MVIPKGFLPSEDLGRLQIQTTAAQGIAYPEMVRHQQQIADIIQRDPNVQSAMNILNGGNNGNFQIMLKPRAERKLSVDQVIQELRPKLAQVPGITAFLNNPPPITIGSRGGRASYQVTLQDVDTDELYRWAPVLEEKMGQVPILLDVNSDLQLKNPQLTIKMDRDRIAALGLTVNQVETAMSNAYGTRQVSQIYAPNNQYQVILGVAPEFQMDPSALSQLYVRSPTAGRLISLNSVAKAVEVAGPLTVSHTGQLPSVTISFNLKPGVALGDAVDAVQQVASATLPSTVTTTLPGHGAGVSGFAPGAGHHPRHGDRRDLHRPRHPVRELHPSADDSFRFAVGGIWRARSRCSSSTRS